MRIARGGVRSVVAEQPDPGRIKPRRFGPEGLPWLGHVPDALLDRLEVLLARLANAALVGPLLTALNAPLLGGRALDIGVARLHIAVARLGERFARRGGRLMRGLRHRRRSLRW